MLRPAGYINKNVKQPFPFDLDSYRFDGFRGGSAISDGFEYY